VGQWKDWNVSHIGIHVQTVQAPNLSLVTLQRQLFWENVVREMLTGLSMLRDSQPELFDGRIALLTRGGERIPIADVTPMFACGIPGSAAERAASIAVECTVFRVRTPGGEVFTLPLAEIRSLHTLTPELMQELEKEAGENAGEGGDNAKPFGLAAFRSITHSGGTAPGEAEPGSAAI
jgi:hypothetical protein